MRRIVLLACLLGCSACTPRVLVRSAPHADALAARARHRPADVETCGGVRYDRVSVQALGPDSLVVSDRAEALDTLALAADVRTVRVLPRRSRAPYYVFGAFVSLGMIGAASSRSCPKTDWACWDPWAVAIPSSLVGGAFFGGLTAFVLSARPAYEYRFGCEER